MSDTPRTDRAAYLPNKLEDVTDHYIVSVGIARQLERELAEAEAEVARLRSALEKKGEYGYSQELVDALTKDRNKLEKYNAKLLGLLEKLQIEANGIEADFRRSSNNIEDAIKGEGDE